MASATPRPADGLCAVCSTVASARRSTCGPGGVSTITVAPGRAYAATAATICGAAAGSSVAAITAVSKPSASLRSPVGT